METSNMDDLGTRKRRAFRLGWVAGLRNKPQASPDQDSANLDLHWSRGFRDGTQLRQTWDKAKSTRGT